MTKHLTLVTALFCMVGVFTWDFLDAPNNLTWLIWATASMGWFGWWLEETSKENSDD